MVGVAAADMAPVGVAVLDCWVRRLALEGRVQDVDHVVALLVAIAEPRAKARPAMIEVLRVTVVAVPEDASGVVAQRDTQVVRGLMATCLLVFLVFNVAHLRQPLEPALIVDNVRPFSGHIEADVSPLARGGISGGPSP